MRRAFFWSFALCLAAGCTKGSGDVVGHHPDMGAEAGGSEAGVDMGGAACTTDAQCNDSMDCTIDHCGVGNVCTHTDTCTGGLSCTASGCAMPMPGACNVDADCDDHNACNGVETCLMGTHMCLPGRAMNCDDGDACTNDACDATSGHCTHMVICDGGTTGTDAGPGPFDPGTDYTGMFAMVPAANSGCGCATFTVNSITFSVVVGTLDVTTSPTSLGTFTQTPAPTGTAFDVTLTNSCGTYEISGMFSDRDTFSGNWSATFSDGLCPSQNMTIVGVRR